MSLSLSSDFHMWVEEGKVLQAQESKKKKIWQQNSVISLESTIVQYLLILSLTVIYDNAFWHFFIFNVK